MATEEPTTAPVETTASHLEEEKTAQEGEFVGATLQIESETQNGQETPDVDFTGPAISRNRPGSVIGRRSILSTGSRTSLRPGVVKSDNITKLFFSYKENSLQSAVDKVSTIIKPELDGELLGAWLLTE
ncbi:hypothetical protein V1264_007364 [Littorina saxatilis]|uniref:Uncharacterized protein n=2 Tax=Littorina saxatilis TaxID=31220 RepID=A0AAN9AUQ1_9CAEN